MLRWLKDNDLDAFCRKFYANGFVGAQLLVLTGTAFRVSLCTQCQCSCRVPMFLPADRNTYTDYPCCW